MNDTIFHKSRFVLLLQYVDLSYLLLIPLHFCGFFLQNLSIIHTFAQSKGRKHYDQLLDTSYLVLLDQAH